MTNQQLITQESKWFEKNASQHQGIHIPIKVAPALKLKHDDKIAAKPRFTSSSQMFPAKVQRIKRDGNCFRFQVPLDIHKMLQGSIKIQSIKLNKPEKFSLKKMRQPTM